jgi:hypothetical protein
MVANDELERTQKEVVTTHFKLLSLYFLLELRNPRSLLVTIADLRTSYSSPRPPEYEADVLTTQLRRSAFV